MNVGDLVALLDEIDREHEITTYLCSVDPFMDVIDFYSMIKENREQFIWNMNVVVMAFLERHYKETFRVGISALFGDTRMYSEKESTIRECHWQKFTIGIGALIAELWEKQMEEWSSETFLGGDYDMDEGFHEI